VVHSQSEGDKGKRECEPAHDQIVHGEEGQMSV